MKGESKMQHECRITVLETKCFPDLQEQYLADMTYEEAVQSIPCGRYRHFKGKPYEVIGIARHSETEEPMVVYRALYGDGGIWVRPAEMWNETVTRDSVEYRRFMPVDGVKLQMAAFSGQQGRNSRPVKAIIGGQQAA